MSAVISQRAHWRDYLELTKPKVVALMLITSVVGMCLATPGWVGLDVLVFGNLGIALCAGSAACINHLVDQGIDAKMSRTSGRPVATGKVARVNALSFAAALGVGGTALLLLTINAITAWLTVASLVGYAFVYTLYLKRATPQNIVIGGLAGAAPPLLGWTAVTGSVDPEALLLVLIIFAWTPPHFWALAIHRKDEYAKVDVPMLPVTHGDRFTRLHIALYTIILALITTMPYLIGMSGIIYAVGAAALNIGYLYWAVRLFVSRDPKDPMRSFGYSIWYLFGMFIVLLVDHYLSVLL
ncbi:protoheme IX farnesyltransferase [Litorivicinus lipolyticus]|uniref:Protoheme IX farnesyltransferase n=1 Tax=Litorivicinus lipolyticus TaxID=418701 RepID=A0A5Q2QBI6_9GAMM|nr:heme o synthase [Litorivicinus lipolyticus]QGG79180.1 protoheme IX farnesyltransferase [Litorivicinus lipolyticus]